VIGAIGDKRGEKAEKRKSGKIEYGTVSGSFLVIRV
jgi:hypothetical protein